MTPFKISSIVIVVCMTLVGCISPEKVDVQVQVYYDVPLNTSNKFNNQLLRIFKVQELECDTFYVPQVSLYSTRSTKDVFTLQTEISGVGKLRESFGVNLKQSDYSEANENGLKDFQAPDFLTEMDESISSLLPSEPYYTIAMNGNCITESSDSMIKCFPDIKSFEKVYESILAKTSSNSPKIIVLITNNARAIEVVESSPIEIEETEVEPKTGESPIETPKPPKKPKPTTTTNSGVSKIKLTLPGAKYESIKNVYRKAEKLCWKSISGADKIKLQFTSAEGRGVPTKTVNAKTKCYDLVNLGVGTTPDVFDVSIEILDKKGKVIGRGSMKNFQISCK